MTQRVWKFFGPKSCQVIRDQLYMTFNPVNSLIIATISYMFPEKPIGPRWALGNPSTEWREIQKEPFSL